MLHKKTVLVKKHHFYVKKLLFYKIYFCKKAASLCKKSVFLQKTFGLFTVLFISNACHNLLQQPKPSILSFIATFVQAENCTEYCSVLFIYFPKVINCNNQVFWAVLLCKILESRWVFKKTNVHRYNVLIFHSWSPGESYVYIYTPVFKKVFIQRDI